MLISEQKAMDFPFLKIWLPPFFVLNKTERRITCSLNLAAFSDLRSDFFLYWSKFLNTNFTL